MDDQEESFFDEVEIDLSHLQIFDRHDNGEAVPEGFSAAIIRLDAKPSSSLNWAKELASTQDLLEKGHKVLFELDLDLFGPTSQALTHTGQFQTHVLAINEFCQRFLDKFSQDALGVILHRAKNAFRTAEERDIAVDYLELLRAEIPDSTPCLLLFDCKEIVDPFAFIRLFALDRFSLFTLALAHAPIALKTMIWNEGKGTLGSIAKQLHQTSSQIPLRGLLMPRFDAPAVEPTLKEALYRLMAEDAPFKIIPETHLPLEWDGLDELIVSKEGLLPTSLRTIEGFAAAGGHVQDLA